MRLVLALAAVALALPGTASALTPFRPGGTDLSDRPADIARAAVDQRPGLFDGADDADLSLAGVRRGPANVTVVRLAQEIDGVPVLGGEVVVAVDRSRRIVAGSGEVLEGPGPDTHAALSADMARSIAMRQIGRTHGPGLVASDAALAIFDPTIFGGPGLPGGTLVWDMTLERPGFRHRVLIDADRGTVVLDLDDLAGAKERYVCDAGNSIAATTEIADCTAADAQLVRSEGGAEAALADANRAYEYAGTTYDFYASLGRDSIDGAGMALKSTVRGCRSGSSCPLANAYWDTDHMVYGAGYAASEDVVAHELTHGVTDHESNLLYWMQPGAINESLSDVFGEFVDLTYGGDGSTSRWLMGEDIPGGAIRSLANPPLYGDPDSTDSVNYYAGTWDNGGVHVNSGVGNKAAYLMVDGGTFGGETVSGIGIPKAAAVWYQAARLLRSGSSYADLAVALRDGCATLVGTAGVTSSDCLQVGKATTAVKMSVAPPSAPVPQAAVCSTGTLRTVWGDSFESGYDSWSVGSSAGGGAWYPSTNYTWNAYPASGRASVFAYDFGTAADTWLQMRSGVAVPAGAYLRFNHAWEFVGDGGTVEYSTDGVTWTDVTALGAGAIDGGYTGVITTPSTNPRAGTSAFTGNSNGLTSMRVSLASLEGQSVRFRFRYSADAGTRSKAWYVDDVAVYACDAATTTSTTVTVARDVPTKPANGTVQMVPSGQTAGTGDVFCRFGDAGCDVASSAGSFVTLQAVPDDTSAFAGWTGACSGSSPTCVLLATQANAVTARFAYTAPAPPAVVSFTPTTASPTTAESLAFRLEFDEAVSGLQTDDLSYGTNGTLTCDAPTIAGVGGSTSVYAVTYGGCSGDGVLRPTLLKDAVADADASTGPALATQASSGISRATPTPPVALSFGRLTATPTTSPNPVFSVTFDEDVSGVAASDFSMVTTGQLVCSVASVAAFTARIHDVTASCSGSGTVKAVLAANAVADELGTPGPASAVDSAVTTVDTAPPGVVSFTRIGATPTASDEPAFRITFDEDVSGVDAGDFDDTTTGSLACVVGSVTPVSARVYDVGTICSGAGTVAVVLAAGSADDALGTAGPAAAVTSAVTAVDTVAPQVQSFARVGASTTTSTQPAFRVTFDEDVTGLTVDDFTVDASGGLVCSVISVTAVTGRVFDAVTACVGQGDVALELRAGGALDVVGIAGPSAAVVSSATTIVAAPAPAAPTPATTSPAASAPANGGGRSTPPSLRAASVAWRAAGRALTATFKASAGTTYRIAATRGGRVVAGRCAIAGGTARCRVALARGAWRVAITPSSGGLSGTPATRSFTVR